MSYPADFKPSQKGDVEQQISTLKETYLSGVTRPIEWRRKQLMKLFDALENNTETFQVALAKDFGKPAHEVLLTELQTLKTEIVEVLGHIKAWMKPESGDAAFPFNLTFPKIEKRPLGVALIIGAWNYPLFVTLGPLIGAIAAGCPAIIKPSELAPNCAVAMEKVLHQYLDRNSYRVVQGGVEETTHLLNQKWDTIFYTGGGNVGRIVATAAAKNLTPVTLELGGKNAVVITKNADLKLAARRIAWGKVTNAGQTCVAPDYILFTDPGLENRFTEEFKKQVAEFYPEQSWRNPGTYTRIVNTGHFNRIKKLIDETSGKVVVGGFTDASQRLIEPTLVSGCTFDDSLMSQEIFGPVLPMLQASSLDDAIRTIQRREKSLAVYIFSNDKSEQAQLLENVDSGGAMVNDVMHQCAMTRMPFGGVGESGTGAHNGVAGFNAFTHRRTVVKQPGWLDGLMGIRYAPYTPSKISQFKMLAPKRSWNADYTERSFFRKVIRFSLSLALILAAYKYIQPRIAARL
ncbi:Hexadecenal dehydrogenase [Savitreella phatthalungensis]